MRLKKKSISFSFVLILLLISCKATYVTSEFNLENLPPPPDYNQSKSWAVLPEKWDSSLSRIVGKPIKKEADVFYIYPTLFVDRNDENWNSDIFNPLVRKDVIEKAVVNQASAWVKAANLYVPYYRQAHYRIFVEPYSVQGKQAGVIAYQDVKKAFIHFLENFNQSRPIIIASHSQGSIHAKRLLKEFFDGKPLQKKLIAAYLIGARIYKNEFKYIPLLEGPKEIGGFVSWNTYKKNHLPKKYYEWYKGGAVTNPITWDKNRLGPREKHLGVLGYEKKIHPKSLSVQIIDGMLWSSLPRIKKRFFLSFIKNYHFADVNLFWKDIEQNALLRTQQWIKTNKR